MLTLGKRLEIFRRKRVFREDGTHLSQGELYRKARAIENPPPRRRKGIGFAVASGESRQAEIIRQFEKDEKVPTEHQRELLERALELPAGLLNHNFDTDASIDVVLQQLGELSFDVDTEPSYVSAADSSSSLPLLRPADFVEGMDLSSGRVINSRNRDVIEKLNAFLRNDQNDFRLVCLGGKSGSGKSHLLSDWYSVETEKPKRRKVISPDTNRYNSAELIGEIVERICGCQTNDLNAETARMIDRAEPAVIVLDGLTLAAGSAESKIKGISEKTTAVVEFIIWLQSVSRKHNVMIAVQDERWSDDPLSIEMKFSPSSKYLGLALHELETEQAVELVETKLNTQYEYAPHTVLPREEIRQICRRTDKLPITLEAICGFISGCQNTQEVEDFLVSDIPRSYRHEGFSEFFSSYLEKMDPIPKGSASHPVAVLRLLSLMPGSVPETWLEMLMREVSIKRVNENFFSEVKQNKLPFLVRSGGEIDLHALARAELIRNSNEIIQNDAANPNLNGKENLAIHLAMAKVCRNIIKLRASKKFLSSSHARAVEHLVHHLISYRDLKVQLIEQRGTVLTKHDLEEKVFTGSATAEEVTRYCWEDIVCKFVLDRRHRFTRYLGQFERKSKLLRYFFPDQDIGNKIQYLGRSEADEILKEISICHAHLGRLNSSLRAVKRATEHVNANDAAKSLESIDSIEDWMALTETNRADWTSHFEAVCHECLVHWRRSSQAAVVDFSLEAYRGFFSKVTSFDIDPEEFAPRPLLRAARRFLTRDAHILLYQGEVDRAVDRFGEAEQIEQLYGRDHLTGEAARRHIQSLSRMTDRSIDAAQKISSILDFNNSYLARQMRANRYESTDVVAWLYTDAAINRARSNFDEACQLIEQSEKHPLHQKGQVPFFASGELQLEKVRLANAMGTSIDENKLIELIDHFAARDHNQLACEAMLVRSEAVHADDQEEFLFVAESRFEADGWELRLNDVEMIRNGEKPSARFVF